jgi:hypothetical protein
MFLIIELETLTVMQSNITYNVSEGDGFQLETDETLSSVNITFPLLLGEPFWVDIPIQVPNNGLNGLGNLLALDWDLYDTNGGQYLHSRSTIEITGVHEPYLYPATSVELGQELGVLTVFASSGDIYDFHIEFISGVLQYDPVEFIEDVVENNNEITLDGTIYGDLQGKSAAVSLNYSWRANSCQNSPIQSTKCIVISSVNFRLDRNVLVTVTPAASRTTTSTTYQSMTTESSTTSGASVTDNNSSSNSTDIVIGVVVGVVGFCIIIAVLLALLYRRRRYQKVSL